MNVYEKLYHIKRYSDAVGSIYGTEDFGPYFYSLVKMRRPQRLVELGTGLGLISLWAGLALEENGSGRLITIDNGSEWSYISQARDRIGSFFHENYTTYIQQLISTFELSAIVHFEHAEINEVKIFEGVDILFSDFSHGPLDIIMLLSTYLECMSECSVMMFDSASTYYPSYQMLEQLVPMLNAGRVPQSLLEHAANPDSLRQRIQRTEFKLHHVIEAKPRPQNSTACLYLQPIDVIPYPRTTMRAL